MLIACKDTMLPLKIKKKKNEIMLKPLTLFRFLAFRPRFTNRIVSP